MKNPRSGNSKTKRPSAKTEPYLYVQSAVSAGGTPPYRLYRPYYRPYPMGYKRPAKTTQGLSFPAHWQKDTPAP